jgi:chromosome segregation ATPase
MLKGYDEPYADDLWLDKLTGQERDRYLMLRVKVENERQQRKNFGDRRRRAKQKLAEIEEEIAQADQNVEEAEAEWDAIRADFDRKYLKPAERKKS